jgi:hypothetical protein
MLPGRSLFGEELDNRNHSMPAQVGFSASVAAARLGDASEPVRKGAKDVAPFDEVPAAISVESWF